ncbi:DUF2332 family protein [Pseudomonas sp. R2.Fl]|nr:DUF2332 family protein [Pseudomonas sp. R2.Fl]
MTTGAAVRASFERQAKACDELGSSFTARLCRLAGSGLSEETAVGRHILSWRDDPTSTGDAVALRFAGALHALVLSGDDQALAAVYPPNEVPDNALWSACEAALARNESFILNRLKSAPQTNEVRRSSALLPGFLTIAGIFGLPLVLSEVGASAGLNLQWDRYRYTLGDLSWGPDSAVVLTPDWQGPPPPDVALSVIDRAGCDLNPLDSTSANDRLRLMSYIWADQSDRLERTRRALAIAEENRLEVDRADAIDWLADRLFLPRPGAVHVVYHTIAWQYLPAELKAKGEALIMKAGARATADAPIAHLQLEADGRPEGAAITLQVWPNGEQHHIGRADFHGRWVKWKGWPL